MKIEALRNGRSWDEIDSNSNQVSVHSFFFFQMKNVSGVVESTTTCLSNSCDPLLKPPHHSLHKIFLMHGNYFFN